MAGVSLVLFLLPSSYAWFLVACVAWSVASGVSGAAPATYAADLAPGGMNAAAMSAFRMLGIWGTWWARARYTPGEGRAVRRRVVRDASADRAAERAPWPRAGTATDEEGPHAARPRED